MSKHAGGSINVVSPAGIENPPPPIDSDIDIHIHPLILNRSLGVVLGGGDGWWASYGKVA